MDLYGGMLGDRLIENGEYDKVMFDTRAIGGSSIKSWVDGDGYNQLVDAFAHNSFDIVIFMQGESDTEAYLNDYNNKVENPSQKVYVPPAAERQSLYEANLHSVINNINSLSGFDSELEIYIAKESYFAGISDDSISSAQQAVIDFDLNDNVYAGIDLDNLNGAEQRYDGLHLSEIGVQAAVDAWDLII